MMKLIKYFFVFLLIVILTMNGLRSSISGEGNFGLVIFGFIVAYLIYKFGSKFIKSKLNTKNF